MEDGGNIRMPQACCRPRFPEKALARSFAVQVVRIYNLQRDIGTEIGVERFVRYTHRAPPEFPK